MSNTGNGAIDRTEWDLAVDDDAGELHIEHAESGNEYVFDSDGALRVPGDGDVGDELHDLRDALASTLEGGEDGQAQVSQDGTGVEIDRETGELIIQSNRKITLDAPEIELTTGETLAISGGEVTVESTRATTLAAGTALELSSSSNIAIEAALVEATATGPMNLEGAIINLN